MLSEPSSGCGAQRRRGKASPALSTATAQGLICGTLWGHSQAEPSALPYTGHPVTAGDPDAADERPKSSSCSRWKNTAASRGEAGAGRRFRQGGGCHRCPSYNRGGPTCAGARGCTPNAAPGIAPARHPASAASLPGWPAPGAATALPGVVANPRLPPVAPGRRSGEEPAGEMVVVGRGSSEQWIPGDSPPDLSREGRGTKEGGTVPPGHPASHTVGPSEVDPRRDPMQQVPPG